MGDYMVVPAKLVKLLKELNLDEAQALWKLPQNGQLIIKHFALERVAAHLNIQFDLPTIIESSAKDRICILIVEGKLGDKRAWSVGEAAPYNIDKGKHQQPYPYAMSEKRAKDRCILKLIDLHGEVYSEDEVNEDPVPMPKPAEDNIIKELNKLTSETQLMTWFKNNQEMLNKMQQSDNDRYKKIDIKFGEQLTEARKIGGQHG